jgi:hypothetical protein
MKLLVGVPSRQQVDADFWLSTLDIWGHDKHEKYCCNWRACYITEARNEIVNVAQTVKATHLLFLDSDNTFPKDVISTLLSHNKDIVGATYIKRTPPYDVLGEPMPANIAGEHLIKMNKMPTGCLMIRMSVFDKLEKPYFRMKYKDGKEYGEDYNFCEDAIKLGYTVWCDQFLSMKIGHVEHRVITIPLIQGGQHGN